MAKVILTFAIVCSMAGSAAAQCCGDCSGDGQVTINELITAVNNALDGCGGATPTTGRSSTPTRRPTATPTPGDRCPFQFTDDSRGGGCAFRGGYNRGCGSELGSLLTTNGGTLIVALDTMLQTSPVVLFGAQVASATSANLIGWSTDNFQTTHPTAGTIQLMDNGSELVIFPNDPPFMILGCNFVQYVGAYIGNTAASTSVAGVPGDQDRAPARERLRAWLERPRPELADP